MENFDESDARILRELQRDAGRTMDDLADAVGLSRNATWRRVRRLEDDRVVRRRVALVDPEALGLALTVFVAVRTDRHDAAWAQSFSRAVRQFPEIIGAYRTSGTSDYLLHARVADMKAYDALYQRLIKAVDLKDVSASFVMEELKEETALPVR